MRQAKWMLCESWTFDRWYSEPGSFGNGSVSLRPLWWISMNPSSMSMLGVPYSPIVPSFTRWQSGHPVAHREQQVEVPDHVRVLRLDRVPARDHRVGRRGLLAVVDDRLGQRLGDHPVEELAVLDVADERHDLAPGHARATPRSAPPATGSASANRSIARGASGAARSCRRRTPRDRARRSASRWASRGIRHRPGSGSAWSAQGTGRPRRRRDARSAAAISDVAH